MRYKVIGFHDTSLMTNVYQMRAFLLEREILTLTLFKGIRHRKQDKLCQCQSQVWIKEECDANQLNVMIKCRYDSLNN